MAALKLLTGNRLYSDKRVFLRELVQNAVDACNLKKIFHQTYIPRISIKLDPGYIKTIILQEVGTVYPYRLINFTLSMITRVNRPNPTQVRNDVHESKVNLNMSLNVGTK